MIPHPACARASRGVLRLVIAAQTLPIDAFVIVVAYCCCRQHRDIKCGGFRACVCGYVGTHVSSRVDLIAAEGFAAVCIGVLRRDFLREDEGEVTIYTSVF
ncbi:hypothetical protein BCR34DRAFT_576630 [Clohesyomyces aquaticus]|uniref:Uncharacterized protein n=1 Tax=Clohesyomyces aquaticus TaxID=1231657 RepID=A0A1Y1YN39_9PLEO|nr:hypothetical protein BCR34DRAFT_576630 [Clohesyomyces aquaticus]